MCGIAGIVDLSEKLIDSARVAEMCGAMIRRGPDANGLCSLPHVVLGHRRLSILDLSPRGNQPMSTPDEDLWIVHNGEIYNHTELRSHLETKGITFKSRTDTETLLYGYRTWGKDLSSQCRGMWAFAIWDSRRKTLYLSRDRFGEKPIYYRLHGTRLAFASTLAALRLVLNECEIDPEAVASLLAYEYIPHNQCIYKGVRKLPPAHYLAFCEEGLSIECYWQLDYRHKLDITAQEAVDRVDQLLDSAVVEQLVADVPVGVFLSGGVDSGYVAALAAKHKPGITAITMTVPGSRDRDESGNARKIANKHSLNSIEIPLGEGCIRELPRLLTTMEPLGDSSIIPATAVAEAASRHLKVVLTGDGGDEAFGGYGLPYLAYQAERKKDDSTGKILTVLAPALCYLSQQRIRSMVRLLRLHSSGAALMAGAGINTFLKSREATPPQVRKLLFGPQLMRSMDRPLGQHLINHYNDSLFNESWEAMLSIGIKTQLVDDFLYKVDTATMFHSIESRAPFLDYRVIEFTAALPFEILMPDARYKALLRRAASRYNPGEVVNSEKKGFSIPVEHYFRRGWGKLLLQLSRDGVAAQMGLIKPKGVKKYLQKHGLRANFRLDRQLFSILVLELWLRVSHERTVAAEELGDQLLFSLSDYN